MSSSFSLSSIARLLNSIRVLLNNLAIDESESDEFCQQIQNMDHSIVDRLIDYDRLLKMEVESWDIAGYPCLVLPLSVKPKIAT